MTCICCQDKIEAVDYKDAKILRKFVTGQFKIIPSKKSGLCPHHQHQVAQAIKRARFMALMPYTRGQTRK